MSYHIEISEEADKKFTKQKKKDRQQLININKKIKQILDNPYHFKPLRGDMHGARRVHIGSFVLTYEILEEKKTIRILDYDHHDKIY